MTTLALADVQHMRHRMRQGTGLSKDMGHFKGTDNARVEEMLAGADDFATLLKKYEKHLRDASAATTGSLQCSLATVCLWLCIPAAPQLLDLAPLCSGYSGCSLPPARIKPQQAFDLVSLFQGCWSPHQKPCQQTCQRSMTVTQVSALNLRVQQPPQAWKTPER